MALGCVLTLRSRPLRPSTGYYYFKKGYNPGLWVMYLQARPSPLWRPTRLSLGPRDGTIALRPHTAC